MATFVSNLSSLPFTPPAFILYFQAVINNTPKGTPLAVYAMTKPL
jgi:hypothetical protein